MDSLLDTFCAIFEPKTLLEMKTQITEATAARPAIKWRRKDELLDDEEGNELYEAAGIATDGTMWYGVWIQDSKRTFIRVEQIIMA